MSCPCIYYICLCNFKSGGGESERDYLKLSQIYLFVQNPTLQTWMHEKWCAGTQLYYCKSQ